MTEPVLLIRLADNDDDFIVGLLPRLVDFPLPSWRRQRECLDGIGKDLAAHLDEASSGHFLFVAEDAGGERVGFIELQKTRDFFTGKSNCHINNIAVAAACERRGVGRALLEHAERWAREHGCALMTLAVFPGNERARALYEACGYGADLLRLAKPLA